MAVMVIMPVLPCFGENLAQIWHTERSVHSKLLQVIGFVMGRIGLGIQSAGRCRCSLDLTDFALILDLAPPTVLPAPLSNQLTDTAGTQATAFQTILHLAPDSHFPHTSFASSLRFWYPIDG